MNNPFFEPWTAPFQAPPFDRFRPEHFRPAYERTLQEHRAEIARIAAGPADFVSLIVALEDSGRPLARVESIFSHLVSADSNAGLEEI
ncbi:MAG TPA: hypothetical protein VIJ72_00195, partial [Rhizomicrobium sp.]